MLFAIGVRGLFTGHSDGVFKSSRGELFFGNEFEVAVGIESRISARGPFDHAGEVGASVADFCDVRAGKDFGFVGDRGLGREGSPVFDHRSPGAAFSATRRR